MPTGYIVNKSLGEPLGDYSGELPKKNGDGLDVVAPTAEQKYRFDKDGWLLVPGVLSESDIKEIREFCIQLHFDPESLPEHERTPMAGPTQRLIDHPVVVGMLNEFMANPSLSSQECYGFSLANCAVWYRTPESRRKTKREFKPFSPHNGNGLYRFPGDVHFYNAFPGKGYSAHTRVVWELNPVRKGKGGTMLVTGSHKAVYTAPDEIQDPSSDIWTTYDCPPGSVLFFAEATTHSGHPWTDEENDRISIPTLYNPVDGCHAPVMRPDPRVLEMMPPMRRTLFRERHVVNNVVGADFKRLY